MQRSCAHQYRVVDDALQPAANRRQIQPWVGSVAKPKILVACPEVALGRVLTILGADTHLLHVNSLADAQAKLQSDAAISLILCGVHFDESRMYDLLNYASASYPDKPFVCCRVLDAEMPLISIKALEIAVKRGGARAFVDLPRLVHELGDEPAHTRFRAQVLEQLPPARSAIAR